MVWCHLIQRTYSIFNFGNYETLIGIWKSGRLTLEQWRGQEFYGTQHSDSDIHRYRFWVLDQTYCSQIIQYSSKNLNLKKNLYHILNGSQHMSNYCSFTPFQAILVAAVGHQAKPHGSSHQSKTSWARAAAKSRGKLQDGSHTRTLWNSLNVFQKRHAPQDGTSGLAKVKTLHRTQVGVAGLKSGWW